MYITNILCIPTINPEHTNLSTILRGLLKDITNDF